MEEEEEKTTEENSEESVGVPETAGGKNKEDSPPSDVKKGD